MSRVEEPEETMKSGTLSPCAESTTASNTPKDGSTCAEGTSLSGSGLSTEAGKSKESSSTLTPVGSKDYIKYQKIIIQDETPEGGMKRVKHLWVAFLMSYSKDARGSIFKNAVHRGEPGRRKEVAKRTMIKELEAV